MKPEAKKGDAIIGGLSLVFLISVLYSCMSGDDAESSPAPAPKVTQAPSDARVTIDEKQAEDGVKAAINLSGYLCADITDVKPAGGANLFAVSCIENRNGAGSAVYLFDGDSGEVSRL